MNVFMSSSYSLSMGATGDGTAVNIEDVKNFSAEVSWSGGDGTTAGTFKLQASNTGSFWDDITGATATVAAGSGNDMIYVPDSSYRYVRIVYTRTGGTGTAQVTYFGK